VKADYIEATHTHTVRFYYPEALWLISASHAREGSVHPESRGPLWEVEGIHTHTHTHIYKHAHTHTHTPIHTHIYSH